MYYSPLRYPGGKAKLAPFMELLVDKLNIRGGTYIEPFAGGAGIAVELLERKVVNEIVINDYDKGIYSFWKAALSETDKFVEDIQKAPLTIEEWRRQHSIYLNSQNKSSYELGFATFYLNRTNRSGIIKGGAIGGNEQKGNWKIDARFNRDNLSNRIVNISNFRRNIHLYNKDATSFMRSFLPKYDRDALVYFDPPYYNKGKQLYLNYFSHKDHEQIREAIRELNDFHWLITYDNVPEIEMLYKNSACRYFDLTYSAFKRRTASEIIIFKDDSMIPTYQELEQRKIDINLRKSS